MADLPTSFNFTEEQPSPLEGEMVWMRVVDTNDDQKTYTLIPGGDPLGGDDQWEETFGPGGGWEVPPPGRDS